MGHTIRVELRPEQEAALHAIADKRGVSVAELILEGVDKLLAETSPSPLTLDEDPILGLLGMIDDGPADVSAEHDHYLVQAL